MNLIVVRHCMASSASAGKSRPAGFSRRELFLRLVATIPPEYRLVVLLDCKPGDKHFTEELWQDVVRMEAGCEAKSFLTALGMGGLVPGDGIVVFLEDDYDVKPGWTRAIEEGLVLADYVTLYDHPDKYTLYNGLMSRIMVSRSCHWRTTPSTTNSYACKASTLRADMKIHRAFSEGVPITNDHGKFLALWDAGRTLISAMPGFWSHEEAGMQPPVW